MGLQVSWAKTMVHVFEGFLDETVLSVHACGEDVEISESFTYLGNVVHNNGEFGQEVLRWICLAQDVLDSLSTSIWCCR